MTSSADRRGGFVCRHDGCGRSFGTKRGLATHKRAHDRTDAKSGASGQPQIPEPARPLRLAGLQLWQKVHESGTPTGLVEAFLILCEQLDERSALRVRVLQHNDPKDRAGLRVIEDQIVRGLRELGLAPALPNGDIEEYDWTRQ